jgi:hypothetical protein
MTRPKGQVIELRSKRGRGYAIRFEAYGRRRYITLGRKHEGWSRQRAEEELAAVLADVRRGRWVSPEHRDRQRERAARAVTEVIFGPFAARLVAERRGQVSESTSAYLEWGLGYLMAYFADWPLRLIDAEAIDAYRVDLCARQVARKRAIERGKPLLDKQGRPARPLSASSINKTIDVLQWLLSVAEEYGYIERNPARGRRRRLPESQSTPVHLDSVRHIEALLGAAAQLDRDFRSRTWGRLP